MLWHTNYCDRRKWREWKNGYCCSAMREKFKVGRSWCESHNCSLIDKCNWREKDEKNNSN